MTIADVVMGKRWSTHVTIDIWSIYSSSRYMIYIILYIYTHNIMMIYDQLKIMICRCSSCHLTKTPVCKNLRHLKIPCHGLKRQFSFFSANSTDLQNYHTNGCEKIPVAALSIELQQTKVQQSSAVPIVPSFSQWHFQVERWPQRHRVAGFIAKPSDDGKHGWFPKIESYIILNDIILAADFNTII